MSLANDIINRRIPDFDNYLRAGESLDDIDEYGFTPLIETAITRQALISKLLLERGVDVNKPDVTGRTALHWAADNDDIELTKLLLVYGANPNAYTSSGLAVIVYPLLRHQAAMKHLLCQYGAKIDFALDFIYAKLLGHRFELSGDTDIVTAAGEFIELDYEGFILEFSVAVIKNSLQRFVGSYANKHLRQYFPKCYEIIDAFGVAENLLRLQHQTLSEAEHLNKLSRLITAPLLILPAASRGHALGFIRYNSFWAKIDRGENSLTEGSVNIYRITKSQSFDVRFLYDFLYKKHSRDFYHKLINQQLGLEFVARMPMSAQIVGNCSWANMQALVPVAYALIDFIDSEPFAYNSGLALYDKWIEWDQERALDECIQRFYGADAVRKASYASMLAAVLFQACDHGNDQHIKRAEKILTILTLPDYYYILQSYLDNFCIKRLSFKGNNLLKMLDDCGFNPNIGVNPIATGLNERNTKDPRD